MLSWKKNLAAAVHPRREDMLFHDMNKDRGLAAAVTPRREGEGSVKTTLGVAPSLTTAV